MSFIKLPNVAELSNFDSVHRHLVQGLSVIFEESDFDFIISCTSVFCHCFSFHCYWFFPGSFSFLFLFFFSFFSFFFFLTVLKAFFPLLSFFLTFKAVCCSLLQSLVTSWGFQSAIIAEVYLYCFISCLTQSFFFSF